MMFKNKRKIIIISVEAILLAMLSACATVQGFAQQKGVKLESVDSSKVHITRIYLQRGKDAIVLRGELKRRNPGFGIVPGYLYVQLIGSEGKVLKAVNIDHFVQAVKSRKAKFSLLIPKPLISGSTIRVTHYNSMFHPHNSSTSLSQGLNRKITILTQNSSNAFSTCV